MHVTIGLRVEDGLLVDELTRTADEAPASAVLVDDRGLPIASAGPHAADLRQALDGRWGPLIRDEGGGAQVFRRVPAGDGRYVAAAAPLGPGTPAALAFALDRSAIDQAVREVRQPLLWLGVFGLGLIVVAAALVARRVAGPVRDLVAATDAVRQGTFDIEVPPAGSDEVGRLTVAFDQMRRDLKLRVEDLDFLRSAQDTLATSLDLRARADAILGLFVTHFGARRGRLLDVRGARGPLALVAATEDAAELGDRPFPLEDDGWLAAAVAAEQETDRVTADDEEGDPAVVRRLLAAGPAWIAVPLPAGGRAQGLVLLGWDDTADLPGEEARRLMAPLAGIAGGALNNARLYQLAALDDVTQLPGTTAFEAALRADIDRTQTTGLEVTLLRIGLDHLDHVVRRRDVALGRELQRACADALLGLVGNRLVLGRLHESELAVRLVGTPHGEARALADGIRERLAAVEVRPEEGGETVATTVSIGIARCPGDARSLEFLLDAAGRALTAARREGGDRIEDAARLEARAVDMPPYEDGAIFRDEAMVKVVEAARRAARTDASVLITGETGTGKEVIANLVHRRSERAERPFVTVNCAAFPETLLESELFGHERGAFTGAERRREGRFELADGGTLFLDEIAEMTANAQVKLLRVLQERQFTRLGGTRTIDVDVRIIAATNRDLERAVAAGTFREDLYYRLNVIRLEIPPLRERRQEIPLLIDHFLAEFHRRTGTGPRGLTAPAMDVMFRHPWPGNVRELKNVIERCAVLCEAEQVGPEHLQLDVGSEAGGYLAPRGAPGDDLNARQRKLLDHLARHGRCTNREYYEMAGTSARTGLRDLQDLMQRGLLVREGKRRGAVYRLP